MMGSLMKAKHKADYKDFCFFWKEGSMLDAPCTIADEEDEKLWPLEVEI